MIPVSDEHPLYRWIYEKIFVHAGVYFGSLLFAISWMLCCWLVGYSWTKEKFMSGFDFVLSDESPKGQKNNPKESD